MIYNYKVDQLIGFLNLFSCFDALTSRSLNQNMPREKNYSHY